ncbi:MAG: hypothetical protein D6766_00190, partial [Verrucomicrobia bacterium]
VIPRDDALLEPTRTYQVRALATGYQTATIDVPVVDNDWQAITVTVDRPSVSEGDGAQALNATITRDPVGSQEIEVELESSDPGELTVPARVSLGPGRDSVSVPLAAVDDDVVDGDQTVQIRAYLLATSSRVRLQEGTGATVTVRDDDGPALFVEIQRKLVAEGLTPATTAIVRRNTGTDTALTVQLASSDETEAVVPPTVLIPAGAVSASFPINSVNDAEADGDQTVVITASAAGFSSGQDSLVVSDRDLPDLVVGRIEAPEFVETDKLFNVTYSVVNQGLAPAGTNWTTRVFLSNDPVVGDDTLLRQYTFNGTLPVNQQFEQTIAVQSPLQVGDYWIVVVTDVADQIREGLESNNARVSAVPVTVRPAYGVTVATDVEQALAGTPIEFYGRATNPQGGPVPSALVNIHITVRGTTRVISALTKADGTYRTTWHPLPNEAGFYEVGAAHPGVSETDVQDTFTLIGMKADPATRSFTVIEEGSVSGTVRLLNLSPIPITGLTAEVVEKPANLTVDLQLGSTTLPGVGVTPLNYTVSAIDASLPGGVVKIHVGSAEGAELDVLFGVTVEALRPKLVARPGSLQAGILRGKSRSIEFTVSNEGGRESGPLNVALPDVPWMSLASINPMPSLQPGQSNVVTLLLTPPADLPLGKYNGNLAIASETTFLSVPYDFRALSEGRGNVAITVVDEFTYYAEGSPKVAGATVVLRDPFTYETVARGETDANGRFTANDLMEGFYNVEVSAPKHTTTRTAIFIEPGTTVEEDIFISRETVRYTWKVEPVEIEDHYKITVETEFETVVPTPVITVEPSVIDLGKITTDITQVNITISNHGLIAADAARLHVPTHPDWVFEPLIEEIGILPARSSLTIPLTIRRVPHGVGLAGPRTPRPPTTEPSEGARRLAQRVALQSGPCHTAATVTWELKCGPFQNSYSTTISMPNAGSGCGGRGPVGVGGGVWIGGGGGCCGGGGGGGGGPSSGYSGPSVHVSIVCDPKCLVLAALGCIPGPVGCFFGGFSCVGSLGDGVSFMDVVDCAVSVAGCLVPGAGVPACIYSLVRCFVQFSSSSVAMAAMAAAAPEVGLLGAVGLAAGGDPKDAFGPGIRAGLDVLNLLTGAPDGVWINDQSGPETGEWFQRFAGFASVDSDGGRLLTPAELDELHTGVQPPGVPPAEVDRFLARWNRTIQAYTQGVGLADGTDVIDVDALRGKLREVAQYTEAAQAAGYNDPINAIVEIIREQNESGEGGTCARVKLKLEQEAVVSRDAFQATLQIDNGDTVALENILVDVKVFDAEGRDVSDLFGLRPPELTGLSDVTGTGRVPPGASATAKWIIIPSVDAAPEKPTEFFVGGEFAYSIEGTVVKVPLEPVSITVLPTPLLYVKYFHQRDVFADDPFTPQIEPSIPFNLAVMV